MVERDVVAGLGAIGGTAAGVSSLPDSIAVGIYALISAVVAWCAARVLDYVKRRLDL